MRRSDESVSFIAVDQLGARELDRHRGHLSVCCDERPPTRTQDLAHAARDPANLRASAYLVRGAGRSNMLAKLLLSADPSR
jgi:hypothetical protein